MGAEDYTINVNVNGEETSNFQGASESQAAEAVEVIKKDTVWGNIGKFVGSLLGITSIISLVFISIRKSKIFSGFTDALLTTFGAIMDMLLIPLIPLFVPVLKLLITFLPFARKLGESIAKFIENPLEAIKGIFAGMGDFGESINNMIENISAAWKKFTDTVGIIWNDESISLWQKIGETAKAFWNDFLKPVAKEVWDFILNTWNNTISPAISSWWDKTLQPFVKEIWSNIKDWIQEQFGICIDDISSGFGETIEKIKNFINSDLIPWWNNSQPKFTSIIDNILNIVKSVGSWIEGLTSFVSGLYNFFFDKDTFLSSIGDAISGAFDWVKGLFGSSTLTTASQLSPLSSSTNTNTNNINNTNRSNNITLNNTFNLNSNSPPSSIAQTLAGTLGEEINYSLMSGGY